MHWCYAIIKWDSLESDRKAKKTDLKDVRYELCELYYDDDGSILGFSKICAYAETMKELKESYAMMKEAFKHPVIEYKNKNFYRNGKVLKLGKFDAKGIRKAGK